MVLFHSSKEDRNRLYIKRIPAKSDTLTVINESHLKPSRLHNELSNQNLYLLGSITALTILHV